MVPVLRPPSYRDLTLLNQALTFVHNIYTDARPAANCCAGLALVAAVISSGTATLFLYGCFFNLALWAFVLSPKRKLSLIDICPFAIVGSIIAGVPGTMLWGDGTPEVSVVVAVWAAPGIFLWFSKLDVRKVFIWIIPPLLAHAIILIIEGFGGDYRSSGLMHNPNLASGFIVIGVTFLLLDKDKRLRCLAIPCVAAILFTGSRWGTAVLCIALLYMFINDRKLLYLLSMSLLLSLAVFLINQSLILSNYRITPLNPKNAQTEGKGGGINQFHFLSDEFLYSRLLVSLPRDHSNSPFANYFVPKGVNPTNGMHNAFLRIWNEWGMVALLAFAAVTLAAFIRRSDKKSFGDQRLVLSLAWLALGVFDYYTIMPHFFPFWWVLTTDAHQTS